jgi:hypothetical protein
MAPPKEPADSVNAPDRGERQLAPGNFGKAYPIDQVHVLRSCCMSLTKLRGGRRKRSF